MVKTFTVERVQTSPAPFNLRGGNHGNFVAKTSKKAGRFDGFRQIFLLPMNRFIDLMSCEADVAHQRVGDNDFPAVDFFVFGRMLGFIHLPANQQTDAESKNNQHHEHRFE